MRKFLMVGAAALSMAVLPQAIFAQAEVPEETDTVEGEGSDYEVTPEQQTIYDGWSDEQRADYDSWSNDQQVYYWSLEPGQQEAYWVLTADQRAQISALSPEQQAQAWASIMEQISSAPAAPASDAAAAPTSAAAAPTSGAAATSSSGMTGSAAGAPNATIRYESSEIIQGGLTATPKDEYPVCKGDVQDGCINPGAAGGN